MVRDPASMSDRELAEWAASLDADARRRIQTALLVAAERSNGSNNYTAAAGSNPTGGSSYSAAAGYNPAGTNQETLPLPPPPGQRRPRCQKACPNAAYGLSFCRMWCKRKDKPHKRRPHRGHYCWPCHDAGYGPDSDRST